MNIDSSYENILLRYDKMLDKTLNYKKDDINLNYEDDSFKSMLKTEIEKLNNKQIQADVLTNRFISGDVENIHDVLIASEEARLHLELAVQVRNKLLEAYKEINNMQI